MKIKIKMQYQQNNYNQKPYQQNQNPAYNQPQYGQQPQYRQQPQYGQQQQFGQYQPYPQSQYQGNASYNDIPEFQIISKGIGIYEREHYVITHAAYDALNNREDPLSEGIIKRIKQQLKGEWMVFASTINLKGFDFSLSIVTGNDFLCFTIKGFRFQVCRLRD